jgi:outer membrane protein
MKKRVLTISIFLFGIAATANAQRIGYVDSQFILDKMPEYRKAQQDIDKLSMEWQAEVQKQYQAIEAMYNSLQAEEVLLTKDMKDQRLAAIRAKENDVREYHRKVFGFEGLLFLKKKELIKPVQDKVFEAVEKVAIEHKIQIVFDKAGDIVMIYTDPRHDYTDYVLEELGLGDKNDLIR